MKTVSLLELAQKDFSVTSLCALRQNWGENIMFKMNEPRKQSALLWFCGSEGEYTLQDGSKLHISKYDLLSIPERSIYNSRFFNKTEPDATILLEFCFTDSEPFTITKELQIIGQIQPDSGIAHCFYTLADDFTMPVPPLLHIKSIFYRLLFFLRSSFEERQFDRRDLQIIERGIKYLQEDKNQALSIDEIAASCYISPNYFRRLFHKFAGMSPNEYRITRKIEQAKNLLENSTLTIMQITNTLGFSSDAYFCRFFKKHTGMTPGEYKNKNP